jgi:hypothetical protein
MKKYIDGSEKAFNMKLPEGFEYPELNNWDTLNGDIKLSTNILDSNNYQQYKDDLETPDKFLQKYYPSMIENGKKPIDIFNEKCFSKADTTHSVNNELAQRYLKFLNEYKESTNHIQEDIDAINEANKSIENMIKQITGESTRYIGNILMEAPEGQPQQNNAPSSPTSVNQPTEKENINKFRNADPNAPKKETGQDRKNIVNYYKAMTSILTAKMKTCNKIKRNSAKILTNYIKLQGGDVNEFHKKTIKQGLEARANKK